MYNDFLTELQNMSIEEIEKQMEQFIFDNEEYEAVKSGKKNYR